jgi:hypothetical protein
VDNEIFGLPSAITASEAWKDIEARENSIGPEQLLSEIIDKRSWTNVEILWVIKRMIFFYGRKDSLLKKAPPERLMMNINDILRAFYIIFDRVDPDTDENLRMYISSKLTDATWGISGRTREYLSRL